MIFLSAEHRHRLFFFRAEFAAFAIAIAGALVPSLLMGQDRIARISRPELAATRAPRLDSSAVVAGRLRPELSVRITAGQSRLGLAPDDSPHATHVWLGVLIGAAVGGALGLRAGVMHSHQCTGGGCEVSTVLDPAPDALRGLFIGGAIGGGIGALWRLLP